MESFTRRLIRAASPVLTAAVLAVGCAGESAPAPGAVLGPGLEERIQGLVAAPDGHPPATAGWEPDGISIEASQAAFSFRRGDRTFQMVLTAPDSDTARRSRNFAIAFRGDVEAPVADELAGLVQRRDDGPDPWVTPVPGPPPRWSQSPPDIPTFLLPGLSRTALFQAAILLALALLAVRSRRLVSAARGVAASEWAVLAILTAGGAALRLVGGTRVPGYLNNHGYGVLWQLLRESPPLGYGPHGDGMAAIHGLAMFVLPRTETSIVAVQFACSVLTVPATWAAARVWVRAPGAALAAAAFLAVLPGPVYYALTEVQMVGGALFAVAGLAVFGLAARSSDAVLVLAAAILGAVACQFHPLLMPMPLVLLAFAVVTTDGRRLLASRAAVAFAAPFVLLWAESALTAVFRLGDPGDTASMVSDNLGRVAAVFRPDLGPATPDTGNVFLHAAFTPPVFPFLAAVGVVAALWWRRWTVLVALAAGFGMVFIGMHFGFLNSLRHQVAAQCFFAMACGLGAEAALAWLPATLRRPWVVGGTAGVVCAVSLAVWPGPLGRLYTPQLERRLVMEGLASVPEECTIVWPLRSRAKGFLVEVPRYLDDGTGRDRAWKGLEGPDDVPADRCIVYYRPPECFNFEANSDPTCPDACGGLRRECRDIEDRLSLAPLFVRVLPALADQTQVFMRDELEVGFFSARKL